MSWKLRGRLAALLLLSVSFINANAGYSIGPAQAEAGDPATELETFATKMIAAQSAAQGHLDQFLSFILDDNGMAQRDAGVKVAVPDGEGAQNLIWLSLVAKHDGQFVGLLADASSAIKNHRVGDIIDFNETQVRDWYYYGSKGKIYGAYTTRVVLGDLPAETVARIGLKLSNTPIPTNW